MLFCITRINSAGALLAFRTRFEAFPQYIRRPSVTRTSSRYSTSTRSQVVGRTVGSRWQVLYGTVYFSRWPVSLSPLQYSTVLLLLMRVIGAASCPMRVPYRTVRCRCLVTVVLVTRTLVSYSFRDKD